MKKPLVYDQLTVEDVFMMLFENNTRKSIYGNMNNFKFLCKWNDCDYRKLTWED